MNKKEVIENTVSFVKSELENAEAGHDWWHILRVWNLSKKIAETEKCDIFIVELGALLHDIADKKFYNGDENIGPMRARSFLEKLNVDENTIVHIENIVKNISFSGGNHKQDFKSKELDIVQDADRLDALGAIGIARAFSYAGYTGTELYNPNIKPRLNMTKEEYKKHKGTAINHFYEKLLTLKDRMNTDTGKALAKHRHKFLEGYLDEFYTEWAGKS